VTLALHPEKAIEGLQLWDSAPVLSDRKPAPPNICRDCRAENDPGTSACWLCGRRDWRADPASPTKLSAEPSDRAVLMSSRRTFLIVLALAVVGTGIARLAPRQGILLLICALSAWAWKFLRAEWKKGEKSPFFIFILPWILLPLLVFVLPVAFVIASIVYILSFFLH